jgi:hypothetical protein
MLHAIAFSFMTRSAPNMRKTLGNDVGQGLLLRQIKSNKIADYHGILWSQLDITPPCLVVSACDKLLHHHRV